MSPSAPAISCRSLKKHYDDVKAVDGLDLEVSPGECFGLLGPNGAGKTTTIEILEGLTRPDSGEVTVLGRHWGSHERELRERLGVSLQESRLTEKLTVYETLELFRSFYERGREPEQLLADLSLEEKRDARVGKLSGGQRQRLAVACALAGDPEILFLDEPTTGLDPQSRLQLWERIARFKEAGRTALLTTHYMEEAERLCDRVAIVDHGRIIAQGTPAELIAGLRAPHFIEFSSEPAVAEELLAAIPGIGERRQRDGRWLLAAPNLAQAVPALLEALERGGARLLSLSTHRSTLEDVFIALTGRELRDE
jgi:ABC-2 type transport system ATP-binding protein